MASGTLSIVIPVLLKNILLKWRSLARRLYPFSYRHLTLFIKIYLSVGDNIYFSNFRCLWGVLCASAPGTQVPSKGLFSSSPFLIL